MATWARRRANAQGAAWPGLRMAQGGPQNLAGPRDTVKSVWTTPGGREGSRQTSAILPDTEWSKRA